MEEQRLYSELLPSDRASHPISKGSPSHPAEKAHFGRLYPGSCPFGHDPQLMTIGRAGLGQKIGPGILAQTGPLYDHKHHPSLHALNYMHTNSYALKPLMPCNEWVIDEISTNLTFINTVELYSTVVNPKTSYKRLWHSNTSVPYRIFVKTVVGGPRSFSVGGMPPREKIWCILMLNSSIWCTLRVQN